MTGNEIFLGLGAAVAAGLVIGFEREQSHGARGSGRSSMGGARTYPLLALVGAISGLLTHSLGPWPFALAFLGVLGLVGTSYRHDVKQGERGLTSEVALIFTFLLGALPLVPVLPETGQRILLTLGLAVVGTVLLSVKVPLHAFLQKVGPEDVFATLKFLLVAVVVLPLLPDRTYGPLEVLNPRKIGLMVVLIAGISFVGYVAVRALGARRGLGFTGLLGGLASSTAVTLSFSARAKQTPQLSDSCALAVVLASSIMFARVLVTVAVVHPPLVSLLAIPMGAMGLGGLGASLWLWQRAKRSAAGGSGEVTLHNPFELSSAVKFAALYAAVLLGAKAVTENFGQGATYAAGILAGATDVDAITLSLANLARSGLSAQVAVTTILLATASNTVAKGVMAAVVGGWRYAARVVAAFGGMIALGALALLGIWLW